LNELCEAEGDLLAGEMRQHLIPVCYAPEYGSDLQEVSEFTRLSIEEIVQLHTSLTFKVYMIGFVPGFAYMGILPPELEMPRRKSPRLEVPAGSVAIAGRQTGIYPAVIPGGWHIIGRTPWRLFDKNAQPCSRLSAGDLVQFEAITTEAFEQLS
jgi:inhibitor of KinA